VSNGTISEHFGNRRHPVYGTITPNLGVEIVTGPSEPVTAVHDGHVVDVLPITGYGDVVLVSHGKFITAYGNLSKVVVSKRTFLNKGDMIGLSGEEESPRGQSVFFMVRESNTNLDPEKWLSQK
jgi:murein DD-endopeptidase MepM/ murein hydrolase activator NlpD